MYSAHDLLTWVWSISDIKTSVFTDMSETHRQGEGGNESRREKEEEEEGDQRTRGREGL